MDGSSGVLLSLVASAGGGIDVAGTSDALAEDRSALAVIAVRSVSGLGRVLGDVGDGGAPYALAGPADAVGGGAGIDLDGVAVPAGSVCLEGLRQPTRNVGEDVEVFVSAGAAVGLAGPDQDGLVVVVTSELGDLVEDALPVGDPLGRCEGVNVLRPDGDEEVEVQAEALGCEVPCGGGVPDGLGVDGAGDLEASDLALLGPCVPGGPSEFPCRGRFHHSSLKRPSKRMANCALAMLHFLRACRKVCQQAEKRAD